MKQTILTFDIGTSAVKASLFDDRAQLIATAQSSYPTYYPAPSYAEQDPADWWRSAAAAAGKLREQCPEEYGRIACIGSSGHMTGMAALDPEGSVVGRAMIHADVRAEKEAEKIDSLIGADEMYARTGNVLGPVASICKYLWVKEHEPERYGKTARFLQSKDYLVYRLTGNMDSTDYSDMVHGMLMDIHTRTYLEDVLGSLSLDTSKLPSARKSTDIAGVLTGEAAAQLCLPAGIPVCVGAGDGVCSNIGAGLEKDGDIYCSMGTTAWIAFDRKEPLIDPGKRIFNIPSADGEGACVYGTIQAAGRSLEWAKQLLKFSSYDDYNAAAASAPEGCRGLIFLPYLEGERSPIFDAAARGVFYGITPAHDGACFARAVMEGVAQSLAWVLDVMREGGPLGPMRIIGGGANSALWKQIIADTCGTDLLEVGAASSAGGSLGTAAIAGVSAGIFADIREAAANVKVTGRVSARAAVPAYEANKKIFRMLYPALRDVYHTAGA